MTVRDHYLEYHEREWELACGDSLQTVYCDDCRDTVAPVATESLENTDADGNRGVWMTWYHCPVCGADLEVE